MKTLSPPPVSGIVVPLLTPLKAPDVLDAEALELLVEHVLAGGVHGLFLLGTCGEGASLGRRVQEELIERVCRQTARRVPVLVCVTDAAPLESASLAQFAAEAGADLAVAAPPFYLPLSQAELADSMRALAQRIPVPLVLYNMPELTKVVLEPPTVAQLMDEPRIVGLKDSSGNLAYFEQLASLSRRRSDWSLLMGPEHLLPEAMALGAHGGVAGGANLFPRLFVDLYHAAQCGDQRVAELAARAARLNAVYGDYASTAASVIKGLKAGLAALGIGNGLPAEPLGPLASDTRATLECVVRELATDAERAR